MLLMATAAMLSPSFTLMPRVPCGRTNHAVMPTTWLARGDAARCAAPSALATTATLDHRAVEDEEQSTAGFAGDVVLETLEVESLFKEGYVVLDGALTEEEVGTLELALRVIDDGYMLQPEEQMGRDDAIRFVDEKSAMLPVAAAMQRLKAIGEALQPAYAKARNDGGGSRASSAWTAPWTRTGGAPEALEPREPATSERLLTASTMVQLASYGADGVYCVHSDNSRDEAGRRRNERALTAILYANPSDWSEQEDGGCLRIWKDSDEVDCNSSSNSVDDEDENPASLGERLRAEGASYVDIAPLQGRCVVFRSTLLHEVLPTKRRPRRAVTQWFYAPFVKK